jgi:hypothetical protein
MHVEDISPEERLAAEAWAAAQKADTYAGFRDYRAKFPMYHAEEAERAIEERLDFDAAAALDTEDAWGSYLERWPDDTHARTAEERLAAARVREETAYSVAIEAKSSAAWQAYLDEFPDAARSAQAEVYRREQLAYEEARDRHRRRVGLVSRNYPDGIRDHDAHIVSNGWRKRRAPRSRAGRSSRATSPRRSEKAPSRCGTNTSRHPDAPRIAEGGARGRKPRVQLAESVNTKTMWRAFVKAWPEGRHRLDAELRLRS